MKKHGMILAPMLVLLALGCAGTPDAPAAVPALSEVYSPPPAATPAPAPAATPAPTATPAPSPAPAPNEQFDRRTIWMEGADIDAAWSDYGGDGFSEIVARLLFQYGLPPEAVCGIAANMWYDSSFQPPACSADGSYGVCEWLGVRRTRLWSWCGANDYEADSVEGQLAYLMHELESYPVELTGSARDCAESFCKIFEAPPDAATQARLRGDYAEALYARFFGR